MNAWKADPKLVSSILRFVNLEIYIPNDIIIIGGEI